MFNNRPPQVVIKSLEALLDDLAAELKEKGWAGRKKHELPRDAVLPVVGMNEAKGSEPARLLLTHGVTIPFLCQGHGLKAAMDHPIFGAHFKRESKSRRWFFSWLMVTLLRRAIASPDMAGPLNWYNLRAFSKAVTKLFAADDAEVGVPFADGLAIVRLATEGDKKPRRPQPAHMLVLTWPPASTPPILSIRMHGKDAGGAEEEAHDVPDEAARAMADALHLAPAALESSALVSAVLARTGKNGYTPTLPESDAQDAEDALGGEEAAAPSAASLAPPSAPGAPAAQRVPLPTSFSVPVRGGRRVRPLALSWDLRCDDLLRLSPTFRTEFACMLHRGNCSSIVEQHFGHLKNTELDNLPFKSVVKAAHALGVLMQRSLAGVYVRWAAAGDPVNQKRYAALQSGAPRRAKTSSASIAGPADALHEEEEEEEEEEEAAGVWAGGAAADDGATPELYTAWGMPGRAPPAAPRTGSRLSQLAADAPDAVRRAAAAVDEKERVAAKQAEAATKAAADAARSAGIAAQKGAAAEEATAELRRAEATAAQQAETEQRQRERATMVGSRLDSHCSSCGGRPRNQACALGACCGVCCAAAKRKLAHAPDNDPAAPARPSCTPGTHR